MSVTAVEDAAETLRRGETLRIPERVVVAPSGGVFEPHPPRTVTTEGEIVEVGQIIGVLRFSGTDVEVRTPFAGFLIEMLAARGERVREGQPIAWLRVFDPAS